MSDREGRRRRPSPSYANVQANGNTHMDYFEQRRQQRLESTISIWPPSPAPSRSASPDPAHKRKKSSRKSKRASDSDLTDSEAEERRRRKRRKEKKRLKALAREKEALSSSAVEDDWVERPAEKNAQSLVKRPTQVDEESDEEIGPMPMVASYEKHDPKEYGEALRKGEGSAMAAFIAEGQRIPRRGEIGLESEQIEKFEKAGYVMSGSRNRKMNAVRLRKENQVITAEEKRAVLKAQKDAKVDREREIVDSFKEMIAEKLGTAASSSKQLK